MGKGDKFILAGGQEGLVESGGRTSCCWRGHRQDMGARQMPAGFVALGLGSFGIGLTEFVIAGLLPEVSRDLGLSESAAGWLISGYALSVAIGAILLTAATTRFHRKAVLVGLVTLFALGNLLSAAAPTYAVALLGRVVAALCHGSFFGIGSLVARRMVPPERASRAVAVMFAGLTIANVLGVPFGTLVANTGAGAPRSGRSPELASWPWPPSSCGSRPGRAPWTMPIGR